MSTRALARSEVFTFGKRLTGFRGQPPCENHAAIRRSQLRRWEPFSWSDDCLPMASRSRSGRLIKIRRWLTNNGWAEVSGEAGPVQSLAENDIQEDAMMR